MDKTVKFICKHQSLVIHLKGQIRKNVNNNTFILNQGHEPYDSSGAGSS